MTVQPAPPITKPSEEVLIDKDRKDPLLSIQNLRTHFELKKWGFGHAGTVKAVDDVSFDLYRGEAVAVVGESGCGKSTLMKTILGLYRPTAGDVIFNGRKLSELSGAEMQWYRSQVGFVQQDPFGALPPFMTIKRILEEPLIIHGMKKQSDREERILETLSEVRLQPAEDFLPKFPHQLSGGQLQRIVIARAMLLRPKLIVADEPVSMLDASVRVEILRLLQKLQTSHDLAVIYITHDLSTVRYFSERIFVMYAGKLVEKCNMDDILRNPQHPYTDALLMAIPDPDPNNAHIFREVPPGEPPSLITPPTGCRFHPRCPKIIEGICMEKEPPHFQTEPGHLTACWLYE
jgi:peptide/nickel transport system ATP-binding protein